MSDNIRTTKARVRTVKAFLRTTKARVYLRTLINKGLQPF